MEVQKIKEEINGVIVDSEIRKITDEEYYISEYSSIYSKKSGVLKLLKTGKDNSVGLRIDNGPFRIKVDEYCLKIFKPNEKKLEYVKYLDCNFNNKHFSNLEWSETKPSRFDNKDIKIEEIVTIGNEKIIKEVVLKNFGYDGYYISEYGQPYSVKRRQIVPKEVIKRKSGFDYIVMSIKKKNVSIDINVAVARCFIPVEKELPYVLYKDGDNTNKHYTNLIWSNTSEKEDDVTFQILPGFSSYKFNRNGVCKSYRKKYPKFLKPSMDENGYYSYNIISDEGENFQYRRNRAVATIFLPNPENKPEVDHINQKRGDDRVENLRWATSSENSQNKDFEKLAKKLYKKIGKFDLEGKFIEEYKNVNEAAASLNSEAVNVPHALQICAHKNKQITTIENLHTSHGYIWLYTVEKIKYQLLPDEKALPLKNKDMESKYLITNFGNIINGKGYKMRFHVNSGYPSYNLKINGKYKHKKGHILVATFFVEGRTEEKCIVNHKNENKMDPHYSNLEWTTVGLNNLYSSVKRRIPVDQFDKETGKFIRSFLSRDEAAQFILDTNKKLVCSIKDIKSSIGLICNQEKGSAYGYIWRKTNKTSEDSQIDSNVPMDVKLGIKQKNKPVDQFDTNGIFIKRFNSIKIAEEETGARIWNSCNEEKRRAKGFFWRYATSEKTPDKIDFGYGEGPVLQFRVKSGLLIKEYPDIFSAAKQMEIETERIHFSCIGKTKTCKNFIWKYKN